MTAPTLQNYPTSRTRRAFNQNPNTGLVASFTPGKGWQSAGYGLPVPATLSAVVEVK